MRTMNLFERVEIDGRPVRGLLKKGRNFYSRMTLEDPQTGQRKILRRKMENIRTTQDALKHLEFLKDSGEVWRGSWSFEEARNQYFRSAGTRNKSDKTLEYEKQQTEVWSRHFGRILIEQIRPAQIRRILDIKSTDGVSPRTLNIYLTSLKNVLGFARKMGRLEIDPTIGIERQPYQPAERPLLERDDIELALKVCAEGKTVVRRQLGDYIALMAFCGARKSEAIALTWADVDFQNRRLRVVGTKVRGRQNVSVRYVDFNPALEEHLQSMKARDRGSVWLFPDFRVTSDDVRMPGFKAAFMAIRKKLVSYFNGFHLLRHYFASSCVMSGVDFMTIAQWLGHRDRGILIAKTYGHLRNEHTQQAARKVEFG